MSLQRPLDAEIVSVGQEKARRIAKWVKWSVRESNEGQFRRGVDGRMEETLPLRRPARLMPSDVRQYVYGL